MSGTSASATQRVSMPRMSRMPPPISAAIVRYASSPGRPSDLKYWAVPDKGDGIAELVCRPREREPTAFHVHLIPPETEHLAIPQTGGESKSRWPTKMRRKLLL